MARLPIDDVRYAKPPASPIVEATLALVHQTVRRRFAAHLAGGGKNFDDFVFAGRGATMTRDVFIAVERTLLDSGQRLDWSTAISVAERPEAYKGGAGGGEVIFDHADAVVEPARADGRPRRPG